MGTTTHWIDDEFEFTIKVKVKPKSVGDWDGLGNSEVLKEKYEKLKLSGEFEDLLREVICRDLTNELFDPNNPEPFDRLIFEVISAD